MLERSVREEVVITNAIADAEKFIARATEQLRSLELDKWYASKERSAMKRQSMELTRSLSELRKKSGLGY